MKLIFVRHGQTDYNKRKLLQGSGIDESMNEEGVRQVKDSITRFNEDFEIIYSSPLKRAQETAAIFADHFKKPIVVRQELIEYYHGSLVGKTWEEAMIISGNPALHENQRLLKYDYRPYGGTSVEEDKTRITGFLNDLKSQQPYSTALIVTHGGVIRLVHLILTNKEVRETDNASIHEFEV